MTKRITHLGKLIFGGFYIGRARMEDVVHETVYGYVCSGYWSGQGYRHTFWGVNLGRWNFGLGRIELDDEELTNE